MSLTTYTRSVTARFSILRYDPAKQSYEYVKNSLNTFSTTSVKTTTAPIKQKNPFEKIK
ncbi:MAG: hypothetical protein PUE95_12885 [Lachnospiraceae bacterium]|nr:hypothetical protein [Lachnospiraceae bacterium]